MINRLIFLLKRKIKYKKFHKKYKFSQAEISKILHKVKYNIPKFFDAKPNLTLLENSGINFDKPIYVERIKNLNFNYAKNLFLAQKIFDFSLVIFYQKEEQILAYKKFLLFAKFLETKSTKKELKESLFLLNINLKNDSDFEEKFDEKIDIQNFQISAKKVKNFAIENTYKNSNFNIIFNEYYYDGKYYFFNNLNKNNKKIIIFIKKTLFFNNFNYFLINKIKNGIVITNLLDNKNFYFLTNFLIKSAVIKKTKNGKNFILLIKLAIKNNIAFCGKKTNNFKPKISDKKVIYFGEKFVEILDENLEENIQKNISKIFNFKLKTNNQKLDNFINNFLPKKVIENINLLTSFNAKKLSETEKFFCLKTEIKLKSIKQIFFFYKAKKISATDTYFAIKNLLFIEQNNTITFVKNDLENYELLINFEGVWKSFKIQNCGVSKMVVDGFEYQNLKTIFVEQIIKSKEFLICV